MVTKSYCQSGIRWIRADVLMQQPHARGQSCAFDAPPQRKKIAEALATEFEAPQ